MEDYLVTCREHAFTNDLVDQMPMPEDALDRERDSHSRDGLGQRLETSMQPRFPGRTPEDMDHDGLNGMLSLCSQSCHLQNSPSWHMIAVSYQKHRASIEWS